MNHNFVVWLTAFTGTSGQGLLATGGSEFPLSAPLLTCWTTMQLSTKNPLKKMQINRQDKVCK